MKSSNNTKQKNETRFLSGEWKCYFSIMLLALLFSFTQNANAQAPDWEWAKGIGGRGGDNGVSVIEKTTGNIFSAGFFTGTVDFDPGVGVFNLTSAGSFDIFFSKSDNSGNLLWAKRIGSPANDYAISLILDASGNILFTGAVDGTTDFDPGVGVFNLTGTSRKWYIAKFDNDGNFIWVKAHGGGNDLRETIAHDNSGNVYSAGYFLGTIDIDPGPGVLNITSVGGPDIFIYKLSSSGNLLWGFSLGSGASDHGFSVDNDLSGNAYITGTFSGTIDFDHGPGVFNLTSKGDEDIFVLKLNSTGNFVWAKAMGGLDTERPHDISIDPFGNVVSTGFFEFTVDFDPGPATFNITPTTGWNCFISKLDSAGNFIWAKSNEGGIWFERYYSDFDADGNVYTLGAYEGSVDLDPGSGIFNVTSKGGWDCFITKLDINGNFIWGKGIGGTGQDFGFSLSTSATGNLIISLVSQSPVTFDSITLTSKGSYDIFTAKIPAPMPTIPRNCSEILKQNPAAPSGVYTIDPDGPGALPSMSCNCDMTTDGGGWMLVLNYNRLSGTNPALNIFTNALPLQNNTAPGFDESNTTYWGHAGNALMNAIPFDELRFYGVTTNHNRVMNFKTNHAGTIAYSKTGLGSMNGIKSQFTPLSGHNTHLPASANAYYIDNGDFAMCNAPFYTVSTYHWDIKHPAQGCNVSRWEVDDWPCSLAPSTFHQIWVRQSTLDPCATITCTIDPKIHMVNVANVTNASCSDGKIKVNLDGTFQFFPYLELYNTANVLVQSVTLPQGSTFYRFKNLVPGHYTVKVFDDKCCETVLVANVKCAPPATGISTTNVTATSVQFNWDVVNCAVGYRIHYREQGSTAWWTTTGVNTNVGLKTVFGLSPSTTYEWQVATKCVGFPAFDNMEDSPLQYFTTPALPINCSEILKKNPAAPSGVYTIDPDGAGGLSPMSCNCDMVTDGGGWMLVLNYNRLSGTDPALKIRYSKLPLQNQTTPGFDESNTIYWGHASNDLMSAIPYDEVRFYGVTTNHNRVMNFKTNDIGTVNYFKTGIGHASGMKSNFTALSGHNTNLPASINAGYSNAGNLAMTLAPFYKMSAYHWDIKHPAQGCNVNRWEVDDWPCSYVPSTFHQIWVRQSGVNPRVGETATRASTLDISLMPNPATHMVTVNFENGNPAAKLKVLNTLAQVVIEKQLQGTDGIFEEQLDVSKLNNGIYFLLIETASETGYARFVKN